MSFPFQTSWRVRFDEVDVQGVVHHSRIVAYLEIARIDYWRQAGISYKEMRDSGFEFIIKQVNVNYLRPLHFDETITVSVGIKSLARASFNLGYEIRRQKGDLAVVAETELVCSKVDSVKPTGLPPELLRILRRLQISQDKTDR